LENGRIGLEGFADEVKRNARLRARTFAAEMYDARRKGDDVP
jgi:hypothetical protein